MHVNFAVQLIKKGIIYGKQFFDFYYNNISGTVFSTADWLVRVDFPQKSLKCGRRHRFALIVPARDEGRAVLPLLRA